MKEEIVELRNCETRLIIDFDIGLFLTLSEKDLLYVKRKALIYITDILADRLDPNLTELISLKDFTTQRRPQKDQALALAYDHGRDVRTLDMFPQETNQD